eukprot:TRINITY_DN73811_c0_g1_i1.p1 TRINITY_DN73811_c0_g1~~TRINITY_DN73811_c0_g1_i1.p1  ORF type:complete len:215 (-),score=34.14 TRINITY_DN73811_c0_g1_i1:94-738(-)
MSRTFLQPRSIASRMIPPRLPAVAVTSRLVAPCFESIHNTRGRGSSPAADGNVGFFMGTAAERAAVEQEFGLAFSSDARLWKESDFSPLVGGARYHIVQNCESASEEMNKNLTDNLAAVIEYGHASYPEFFVPRHVFDPVNPTGGLAPHHVWVVRGYIDRSTRVAEKVQADGSFGQFCLVTLLDIFERGRGAEARLKYRRPGGFEFIVTVAPLE